MSQLRAFLVLDFRWNNQLIPTLVQIRKKKTDLDSVSISSFTFSSTTSSSSSAAASGGGGSSEIQGAARHHQGRHSTQRKTAIQSVLPFLRDIMKEAGSAVRTDRQNVRLALTRAQESGICFWGSVENSVYKSRPNVEAAILNLYFNNMVEDLANE